MNDQKIEKIEDYLLRLTEDVATVKAKLEVIDSLKESVDNMNALKGEIDLLRLTVTTLENRVTKLEDNISEDDKNKKNTTMQTIFTIIATLVSAIFIEQIIK